MIWYFQKIVKIKKGLANELVIGCDCRYNSSFYTSQSFSKQSFDVNKRLVYTSECFDVNKRLVYTMRALM